jgi:hypothetical protein
MKREVNTITALASEAGNFKAKARTSPAQVGAYQEAASRFAEAARIANEVLKKGKPKTSVRIQLRVFAPYYSYESHRCLSMYHYEKHEIGKATKAFSLSVPFLREHVARLNEEINKTTGELRERLDNTVAYCKAVEVDNLFFSDALVARKAWDSKRFVDALDRYRRMATRGEELIESSRNVCDPAMVRISLGNYISTLGNAAAAMAQFHMVNASAQTQGDSDIIPSSLFFDILRHLLQAYKYGMAAIDANPEWSQNRDALLATRMGIEKNLNANKDTWPVIYNQFRDEPEFLKIMAAVDHKLFENVEQRRPEMTSGGKRVGRKKKANPNIRILFLAANPTGSKHLRLDKEVQAIEERLQRSKHGAKFTIAQAWAVRVTDFQNAILRHDPHIIHFSGHGSEDGDIILENQKGRCHPVSKQALEGLFKALKGSLCGVVLNACFSAAKAKSIVKYVDFVIGMSDTIGDEAAATFAASFYQALGYGQSVQTAFDLGCNQIHLENLADQDLPKLMTKKGRDPKKIVLTD